MIKSLNNFFKKSGLYKSKYVYIYSDFRIFISFYKSNPELYIKKFLRLLLIKELLVLFHHFHIRSVEVLMYAKLNLELDCWEISL